MRKPRRGAQTLEFALVFPLLLALFTGILDWGWYLLRVQLVLQAVRDGARSGAAVAQDASPGPDSSAVTATRSSLTSMGLPASDATITAAVSGDRPDSVLTVNAAVPFEPLCGLIPAPEVMGGSLTVRLEDN